MPAVSCSNCAADLPEGSHFCLQCGERVKPAARQTEMDDASTSKPSRRAARSGHRRPILSWIFLGIVLLAIVWAATSDNPFAQGLQDLAGWKHDQTVLDTPFTVAAHSFRYYKFDLPQGSTHVSIVGQFQASGENRSAARNGSGKDANAETAVEVYVLSESAFAVWQNGYAASYVYESGRVSQAAVQADLPAGAGVYYLVFSNKFEARNAKNVDADVLLHYKNLLPESFRRMSERFWNWIGL